MAASDVEISIRVKDAGGTTTLSALSDATKGLSRSFDEASTSTKRAGDAADAAMRGFASLADGLKQIAQHAGNLGGGALDGVKQLGEHIVRLGESSRGATDHLVGLKTALASVAQHVTVGAELAAGMELFRKGLQAIGGFKAAFIDINNQLDTASKAFTGMLGSATAAQDLLGQLKTFAAQTPFEFPDLVRATQRLTSFGFQAEQVIPLLKDVGNTSAYFGAGTEGINRMVLALGQMHSSYILHTQDLNQMAELGVPVWQILADGMHKTVPEVKDMTEKGQILSDTYIGMFDAWVKKTPGVTDAMMQQSTTFKGAMSTIHDSLTMGIADGLRPWFDLITAGTNIVAKFVSGDRFAAWVQDVANFSQIAVEKLKALFGNFEGVGKTIGEAFGRLATDGPMGIFTPLVEKAEQSIAMIYFHLSGEGRDLAAAGSNVVITYAKGMWDAATGVLSGVVNNIAAFIADFFVGHSPPPKGPLSQIYTGGVAVMAAYADGMNDGTKSIVDVAQSVTAALATVDTSLTFPNGLDALRVAGLGLKDMKGAAAEIDDTLRTVDRTMQGIHEQQVDLKIVIGEIMDGYEEQLDPLQRQLDLLRQKTDYTREQRNLELDMQENEIQRAMRGDKNLSGLDAQLKGLEAQRRGMGAAAPNHRLDDQIAGLEGRLRSVPSGTSGNDARKRMQDEIAGLREQKRVAGERDQDAKAAMDRQIQGVRDQIARAKEAYQLKLDEIKAQKEGLALDQKREKLQADLAQLPIKQKIDEIKQAEKDRLAPLEQQLKYYDRAAQSLELQRQHWQGLAKDIKDAMQPLDEAAKKEAAAAKGTSAHGKPDLGGAGFGGKLPGVDLSPIKRTETRADVGDKQLSRGLAREQFSGVGERLAEGILAGLKDHFVTHFGAVIGSGLTGAALGSIFGPIGAIVGALLGGKIGEGLQKELLARGINGEVILGGLKDGLDWLVTHAKPIIEQVGAALLRIGDAFKAGGLGGAAKQALSEVTGGLQSLLTWVGEQAPKLGTQLLRWGAQFVDFVKPYIGPMVESLLTLADRLYRWLLDQAPAIQAKLLKWADEFVHWVAPRIGPLLEELSKLYVMLQGYIFDTAGKIGQKLLEWGKEFVAWVAPQIVPLLGKLGELSLRFLGWIADETPKLVTKLLAWGAEFVAWVGPQIPKLLAELGALSVKFLGWIFEQIPGLTVKLAGWAGEFIAWIIVAWPKMLVELVDLAGKLGGWIRETAAPAIAAGVKEWVPKFMAWQVSILDPGNKDGLLQGLAKIGTAITEWIANFAAKTLPEATIAFVKPFLKPFQDIIDGIKKFTGQVGAALGFVTGPIGVANIVPVGGYTGDTKLYADGGIISEEVHGVGLRTGMKYVLGEAGDEMVVPLSQRMNALSIPPHLANAQVGQVYGGTPLDAAKGVLQAAAGIGGRIIGGAASAARDLVKQGASAATDAAMTAAGVSLTLPAGFADFGAAVLGKVKDGILDFVRSLIDGMKDFIGGATGTWHHPLPGSLFVQGSWTHGGTHDNEAAADFAANYGTPIHAPDGGILGVGWNLDGASGRTGLINHENGWQTLYGHVSAWGPSGVSVGQDDIVGNVGSPENDGGAGSGAHLHFVMKQNGAYMRPEDFIPGLDTGGITERGGLYNLHPGEAVIPLDDRRAGAIGGDTIIVNIYPQGQVMTERNLVDVVHEGLQELDRRGALRLTRK